MNEIYKEYRNQNKVVPYLDIIAYPDGYKDDKVPQPVFSKWAVNMKSSGNVDKMALAGSGAKVLGNAMLSIISIGTGSGGVGAGIAGAINAAGDAANTVNKSNMSPLGMAANTFIDYEKNYWEQYYYLMTFEPANGSLGEEHIGKESSLFCSGHWFYDNGDYFEGSLYNDGQRSGIFVFANGIRYFGNIADGLKISYGVEITPDGSRKCGLFENGELSIGLFESEQCAMWGQWSEGVLHGQGVARYADNSVFAGEWSHGQPVK